LRRPVVTSIKRAWVVIEGNVTRIYEFDITAEDITIASLAVPRVVRRKLLTGVNRDRACPFHAFDRPATKIQIGSLHPAILGGLAFRLRRRVTNDRLALDGRSAPILLPAISEPSRTAQTLTLHGTDALPRGAAHRLGKGGAVTLTAACAIRVRHFATGNRQDEAERGENRAQGSKDFSGGHA
jgi:hypothetical protein